MDITIADDVQIQAEGYAGQVRSGVVDRQWLLTGRAPDGLVFRLFRSTYNEGSGAFESPRHHHRFQQFRFTEQGSVNYAPGRDIPEGDIAYFPRGTYYGPQVKAAGVGLLLQFGIGIELSSTSASTAMAGTESADEQRVREQRLQARAGGEIEDGSVIALDRPIVEAIAAPRPEIAPEGYEEPILMHPGAYGYYEAAPGVEIKKLGSFFDHPGPMGDVQLSVVRLSDPGSFSLTAERAQIAWTVSPGLRIADRVYPAMTCLYSPRDEDALLFGDDGVEIFVIDLPRLD